MDPQSKKNGGEAEERARFAVKLRQAREYLGFSQDEVAQHLGIPRSALSNIETGQRKVDAVELKRLAELYKKPLDHFTGEVPLARSALPEDIEHLARKASKLTPTDRAELARFADFLQSRSQSDRPGRK
jgi:transcriptional regulator with XRE-family HTH domain